ncbi:betaine--homocysteine S-methyltransferase [Paracoccus suum]|uniref:Betaine--homocysteine S-methyltransferase n=1 Tax=Paracoccus suum TaxID=2259340 RepID=A0A344PKL8_9RHOB|nr:betaine--homocysteine S-methyltransferase [Paracoccus suum]AXC49923.1 betaine--homocysteine S-methyltransferase [Paracoccus suum]
MTASLPEMLADRPWLLADGATATNLYNMGLRRDTAPEVWNETHPDRVLALHRAAIESGADIILTNSFGGTAARLRLVGAEHRVWAVNHAAAFLARQAADAAGRPVLVAGCIGPTGEIMVPMGTLTQQQATAMFQSQAEALKAGGADLLWIETISSLEEFRAAAEAARLVGMDWCGTMSFDTAGRTMMGATPAQLAALVDRLPYPPVAFGANCGTGMTELLRSIAAFSAAGSERTLIAKANAGVPHLDHGELHYDGTPEQMAEYAVLARDLGARIIGGCCGTEPRHIAAMRRALDARGPGPRPSPEAVAAAMAEFEADADE